jgi:hypothetical protein
MNLREVPDDPDLPSIPAMTILNMLIITPEMPVPEQEPLHFTVIQ